ncbi:MAG: hypothetical protein N2559_15650, partial [Anaerolineae bacterium]|nr:hypothetical protein [Anaerolineae bacterium]
VSAPLRLKHQVLGLLSLDSATPNFFNATHAQRLQAFADQAALALENARLLRETERRAQHLASLAETARDVASQQNLTALLETIWKYRNKDAVLRFENETVEGRYNDIIVCNGKFLGGGMQVSPHSQLDDGVLQVITIGDMGRLEVVLNTPRLYNGTILEHPKVREYHIRTVTIEPRQTMMIEADGEVLGPGPVTVRVRPAALRLRI